RTRLQSGVLWGYSLPLIAPDRETVATLLKSKGYNTGCVGKWHLGLQWALKDPSIPLNDSSGLLWDNIDFTQPIRSGPLQVGFDDFYGISASLDMHPHVYIKNDRVTSVPTRIIENSGGMKFYRKGPIGDDFRHIDVLDHLTDKAVGYIESQSDDKPFFLYFPLPAPHKPIIPSEDFQNQSGLNPWGDFVMQVDATVGRVQKALDEKGFTDNTLFILTSDNGATPGADFEALAAKGHRPSGQYRGNKADLFEGGHRVAFIAQWPAEVAPGSTCEATVCLTDLMATVAEINDITLSDDEGEDSFSLLPLLKENPKAHTRVSTVHHSIGGHFGIREGKWKLMLCPGSGGWSSPRPKQARQERLPEIQLYDLASDVGETQNVAKKYPEVVERMTQQLRDAIDQGRSTAGSKQLNDAAIQMRK
ncbi:MAG: arylsulfatase, partial [Planctomycetota bacterium]